MLITPSIKLFKSSLDANNDIFVEFYSKGGDQVYKNEIEVYDAETNLLAYKNITISFNLRQIIPPNSLKNGKRYKIKVRTYNVNNEVSNWSDYVNFKCSSIPKIALNPIDDNTVKNQTYLFRGTYSQAEGEPIMSFRFIVYDRYRNQLDTSPEIYSSNIEYEFTGFNDDENYYIEIKAKSNGNIEITTGLVEFYVKYVQPKMRTVLKLDNNKEKATVSIEINTIQVLFNSTNYTYSFNNGFIDLHTDKIHTNKNFGFVLDSENWTMNLRFKAFADTKNILTMTSMLGNKIVIRRNVDRIVVEYWYGDILLITRPNSIESITEETVINLYVQKNDNDLITKII